MLIKSNIDYVTLVDQMLPAFKGHLRILHDVEDESIKLYLAAAIDAISTYADQDIFFTEYNFRYMDLDYSMPSSLLGWYTGKVNIFDVIIQDEVGTDLTMEYTIDGERGLIYPHPIYNLVQFKSGYQDMIEIPPNLLNIIFRLGADFFENRETNRVGEPKALPGWVEYSIASVWKARV